MFFKKFSGQGDKCKNFLKETGICKFTAPVELNTRELEKLDISQGELIVYGYQPVMFSAGCVKKHTEKCTHEEGVIYLTDRYQKKFAVKNYCHCCYNVTYNSLSTGEKKRIDFATVVSFIKLLKLQLGDMNLLFLDEMLASIDINGVSDMMSILKVKCPIMRI